jgi:hypothetical protein
MLSGSSFPDAEASSHSGDRSLLRNSESDTRRDFSPVAIMAGMEARSRVGPRRVSGFTVWPLVCGAWTGRPEFACEEYQWRSDQTRAAQQPETIEKTKKRRLLVDHSR